MPITLDGVFSSYRWTVGWRLPSVMALLMVDVANSHRTSPFAPDSSCWFVCEQHSPGQQAVFASLVTVARRHLWVSFGDVCDV